MLYKTSIFFQIIFSRRLKLNSVQILYFTSVVAKNFKAFILCLIKFYPKFKVVNSFLQIEKADLYPLKIYKLSRVTLNRKAIFFNFFFVQNISVYSSM